MIGLCNNFSKVVNSIPQFSYLLDSSTKDVPTELDGLAYKHSQELENVYSISI